MLKLLVDAGVPALVFLAMVVVGMELTADDFRRVARVFATAYLLAQAPIPVVAVVVFRRVRVIRGINLAGADPS